MSGNEAGRPPHYKTPEEFELKINEYFKKGVTIRKVPRGKNEVIEMKAPTISGLAYYLGFESRQSFYDQEKRDGFSYITKRARLFIEKEYEELLQHGNIAGAIFALKNMGWKDKSEIDNTHQGDFTITRVIKK